MVVRCKFNNIMPCAEWRVLMIKKIGVLTSGGDAPGMNAAVRAVVRTAISKGMEVYGIRRGYMGLITGDIFPMDERSVSDIIHRGGTVLYTARCPEFRTAEGVAKAKAKCDELGIEGLVVIGGDGSFRGAADLSAQGVLCIGIPGTIDNDIACTEYTIGFDTAMNTAMEMVDKLRDTSQSHDRCSVVEVMGRGAGHIAVNTGIACGATDIITKEVAYDLDAIANTMLEKKSKGKQNFVVIVAEGIGHAQEIATALQEKTHIESRATVLGHVQRGGSPTVRDRVEATRMGYYAVELLEQGIGNRVVGVNKGELVDYDIQEALSMQKPYDVKLHKIAEQIAF
jgi:6-phosphofructokinase 1